MGLTRTIAGFTLPEILVALALGLGFTVPLIKLLTATQRTANYFYEKATLQERGRFLTTWLRPTLIDAGWVGCRSLDSGIAIQDHRSPNNLRGPPLGSNMGLTLLTKANEHHWQSWLSPNSLAKWDKNVPALLIQHLSAHKRRLTEFKSVAKILSDSTLKLKVGDSLLLADCHHGEVFTLGEPITPLAPFKFETFVGPLASELWFLGIDHQLYHQDLAKAHSPAEAWVEGVESFQLSHTKKGVRLSFLLKEGETQLNWGVEVALARSG